MATDPVCGMYVDPSGADLSLVRENRTYYFCSSTCLDQFADPLRELARLRRRLLIAWPLSVIVLGLTYSGQPSGWPYLAAVLASIVQLYPGLPFYRGTLDALRSRVGNMDVLIAVGTTAAWGYSLVSLAVPGHLGTGYYFDASSLIVTLILTGNYLEHLTRDRASSALRKLAEMLPATVERLQGAEVERVATSELRVGDRIRVRPGERFAADGIVRDGKTTVDESVLTGESRPVGKAPGSEVLAGALNGEGVVVVEASRVGPDAFLAGVGRLLSEAEASRMPLKRTADRIAAAFVPAVLALAVASALAWFVGAGVPAVVALLIFVSVAITACPCAFGIATPAAIVVGTGRAAESGVLYRGHDAIERAATAKLVLTDKTGTLTQGRPRLVRMEAIPGRGPGELLALAAGLEAASEHPLGRAVRDSARAQNVAAVAMSELRTEPGRGVRGRVGPVPYAIVHADVPGLAGELGALAGTARELESGGIAFSVLLEGDPGDPIGLLAFDDPVVDGVPEAIARLRSAGISTVMVTGDSEAVARRVGASLGIAKVHARVSPEGKVRLVDEYRAQGLSVAFVGDGINDAAALARADVGIAIGSGTDVAREAGQVTLVRASFDGVPVALLTARRIVRKVRQNLLWALGYNAVLLPIAAGALVPAFGLGVYSVLPITGAIAMALSSTSVVLNSLSLRWSGGGGSLSAGSRRAAGVSAS